MNNKGTKKLVVKVVFTGPAGAGKTALSGVITGTGDPNFPSATVAGSFSSISYKRDGYIVEIELWDTAGSERYRALNGMYFRNSKGVIAVYDISDSKSFPLMKEYVSECINETEADNPDNLIVVIVGNKSDLSRVRQVPKEMGEEYARTNDFEFFESSAKTNDNVKAIMDKIVDRIVDNPERYIAETEVRPNMNTDPEKVKKNGCC